MEKSKQDLISEEFQVLELSSEFLDLSVKFDANANNEIGAEIPDDIKLRPFFFIKLLLESMNNGAFITSELYVNKQVWQQEKAQIPNIEQKLQLFKDLRKEFQRVRILKGKN